MLKNLNITQIITQLFFYNVLNIDEKKRKKKK